MTNRRSFLKSTAFMASATLISPKYFMEPFLSKNNGHYIGLQLYTVRDAMKADPKGTLTKVAQIGYNSVESAGYTGEGLFYGMKPRDFSKVLKDNNLIMPSSHYRLGEELVDGKEVSGTIRHGWDKAVEDAASVGIKYMVCAYLSDIERGNLEHYQKVAESLNKAGEICKRSGIQLCYHNHDFEFIAQDGKLPYDILLNTTDQNLVKMEMDLYWVTKAGKDPIALFKAHPGRFYLWHVKDMAKTENKEFTEVGNGIIDFKSIFANAKLSGMKYFFVEEDICPGSPFDSIKNSLSYIKSNLKA